MCLNIVYIIQCLVYSIQYFVRYQKLVDVLTDMLHRDIRFLVMSLCRNYSTAYYCRKL